MRIFLYICIRKNKETSLTKNFRKMTIVIKSQTKEIEKGTLIIYKCLDKYSNVPYYEGIFQPKNSPLAQVIIKRFSRFSMSYLEDRI